MTTKLVDGFFLGDFKLAGEIRQRVAKWGATVEDRARLRMVIEPVDDEGNPESTPNGPSDVNMDAELYKLLSDP
ncbi:hypothetical protein ACIOEX_20080 [Streptomyces sp. NPDC087850]|uniref:phage terminase small subunit n=1 Tax=Streptomyces sp. NPDC087850 TaxID=3365809 RepID=UPI00382C8852